MSLRSNWMFRSLTPGLWGTPDPGYFALTSSTRLAILYEADTGRTDYSEAVWEPKWKDAASSVNGFLLNQTNMDLIGWPYHLACQHIIDAVRAGEAGKRERAWSLAFECAWQVGRLQGELESRKLRAERISEQRRHASEVSHARHREDQRHVIELYEKSRHRYKSAEQAATDIAKSVSHRTPRTIRDWILAYIKANRAAK